ncbi:unnamed protein product [Gadus morhua 'NCC']
MLLRVSFGGEQKYMKLPELTFGDFLRVSLKFNIAEDRRLDIKVYDQSNTEVDSEVFEEIVQEFHGPFLISLANEAPGYPQSTSSPCSIASEDTVILNFSLCDPAEEPVAAEGSQPKRPCRTNYEAKALIEKILTTKPGGPQAAGRGQVEDGVRRWDMATGPTPSPAPLTLGKFRGLVRGCWPLKEGVMALALALMVSGGAR